VIGLNPGDTILFIAPSGYLKQDRMALAKKRLEDRGYVTVQADDITTRDKTILLR
jgi:muramoyltetrapeptide carboxypeptidase LdcA involved in peptidoglycan recycling